MPIVHMFIENQNYTKNNGVYRTLASTVKLHQLNQLNEAHFQWFNFNTSNIPVIDFMSE